MAKGKTPFVVKNGLVIASGQSLSMPTGTVTVSAISGSPIFHPRPGITYSLSGHSAGTFTGIAYLDDTSTGVTQAPTDNSGLVATTKFVQDVITGTGQLTEALCARWENTYAVVSVASADWNTINTQVRAYSAQWQEAYDEHITGGSFDTNTGIISFTSEDDSTAFTLDLDGRYATNVAGEKGDSSFTTVNSYSSEWSNTWNTLTANSGFWDTAYTDSQANKDDITNVANASAGWDTTKSTVDAGNSNWDTAYNQLADSTTDVNVDSGTFVVDKSENKVGIGTDSPDFELDVAGDIGIDEYIKHNGDTNTYIRFRADQIDFVTGNITMFTLDEAGQDIAKVNTGGNDVDFQVQGENVNDLIRTDAANDRVGIGTDTPNELFTVAGNMSAQGVLYANQSGVIGDSTQWFSTYTTVHDTSAKWGTNEDDITNLANASAGWDTTKSTVDSKSSGWDSTKSTVDTGASNWDTAYTKSVANEADITNVANASAGWDTTKSTVDTGASNWDTAYTDSQANKDDITNVANASAGWDTTKSTVDSKSSGWDTTKSTVDTGASNWDTAYTDSQANKDDITNVANASAGWDTTKSTVDSKSSGWDSTKSTVDTGNSNWDTAYTKSVANEADITNLANASGDWNAAIDDITNLANASGDWNAAIDDITNLAGTSALWDTTYTTTNEYSGGWQTTKSTVDAGASNWDIAHTKSLANEADLTNVADTSALWDSTYTTVHGFSGTWKSTYEDVILQIDEWNSTWSTLTATSADWETAYEKIITQQNEWDSTWTTLTGNSSNWSTAYTKSLANEADLTNVADTSAFWDTTYTTVNGFSGGWESTKGTVDTGASNWDIAYTKSVANEADITNVANASADWDSVYTNVNDFSAKWEDNRLDLTEVANTSADWDSVYSTTNTNSSDWEAVHSTVNAQSGDYWEGTYTTVKAESAGWSSTAQGGGWTDGGDHIYVTNIGDNLSVGSVDELGSKLTVIGDISSTDTIYVKDSGDSTQWSSTYTTVYDTSAKWALNQDDITNLANTSADWDSVYTSASETSALWDTTYTTTNEYSGGWQTTKGTVDAGSDNWDSTYTTVGEYSGKWGTNEDDITNLANASADWNSVYTSARGSSALWDTTYTTTNQYSGGWETTKGTVDTGNALWDTAYTTTNQYSGGWESTKSTVDAGSDNWDSTYTTVGEYSGFWALNTDDVTNLANASADWNSVYTSARGSSALWNTTYTTTNEYSGGWESTKSTVDAGNALWDTTYTTTNQYSGGWESTKDTVDAGSDNWDAAIDDITNVANTSGLWDSTYTSVSSNSALWDTTYTTVNGFSGGWETAYGVTNVSTAGHVEASKAIVANSSGNVYFDDTQTLYFGDGTAFTIAGYINHNATDFRITNTTTGGNIVIWNQDTDKDIIAKLGNNDNTTKFIVRDSDVADLFTVDGVGDVTVSGKITIDYIVINGTNIGHTSDTDLISLADGTVTVNGAVAATGDVTGNNLNVGDWDATTSTVNNYNGEWNTTWSTMTGFSGGWQTTKSTVDTGASSWDTAYTKSVANEADITNVANASADWNSVYTSANETSAFWDTTYTTVNQFSGKWEANEDDITNIANASADWNSVYTSASETSALWDTTYTTTNEYSGRWETAYEKSLANEADITNIAGVSGTYWDQTYTTVNENSATWDDSAVALTTLRNNSGGWESVEAHVNSTSGLWDSTYTTVGGFSSYWDTVYTTVNTNSGSGVANTLPKWINNVAGDPEKLGSSIVSEAVNTGDGAAGSTLNIAGSAIVTGDLTIQGDFTYLNTDVRVTDQLDIKNEGTGPAIVANQTGTNDIVDFQDDGTSVFKILNDGDITVKAGATVDGRDISADGEILDAAVDDITNVANTSANWDSVYTSTNESSGDWDSVYTSTNESSGDWDSVYTSTNESSGDWDSVYTSVNDTSALWDTTYTTVGEFSGTWQDAAATYTTVNENSGGWESVEAHVNSTSGLWDSTYTSVSSNSALWDTTYTTTNQYSGDWNAWTTTDSGNITRNSSVGIAQAATEPAYTLDVGGTARFADDVRIEGGTFTITSDADAAKLNVASLKIADPTVEINYGGSEANLAGAGIFFDVASTKKGHIRLKTGSPNGFEFKTPSLNGPPAIDAQIWTVNVNDTKTLTVAGDLNIEGDSNINQDVTTDADVTFNTVSVAAGFTSDEWDTTWNTVSSTSAFWETTYTTVNSFSSLWDAAIDDITNIAGTSADWDSAYTTAKSNSGGVTTLADTSAFWETTYTTTNQYSAGWETSSSRALDNEADITNLANASADWHSAYTTAKANSADITNVANASADWNSVYTHINSHSAVGTTHYVPTWTYNGTTEFISTTAAKLTDSIIKQTLKGELMYSLWGASYWAGNNLTSLAEGSVNDGNTASNNYAFHANGGANDGTVWLKWGDGTATLDATKLVMTHAGGDAVWTIKYSDNNSDWTTITSFTESGAAASNTEIWDSQGDHKYWGLFKTGGTNTGWIHEVQFHHLPEIALVTVEGSLSAQSLSATDSTGFSYFAGKVGIGTSSPQVDLHVGGTGAIRVPAGNNAARPSDLQGMIRYNTDGNTFEGNDGDDWAAIGGVSDADQDTKILANASDEDTLHFYVGVSNSPVEQLTLSDGIFQPTTHNDIDLGTSDERFKTLYLSDAVYFNTLSGHTGTFDGNLSAQDVFTTNYANVSADLSVAGVTTITTLSTQGGELDNVVIGSTTPVAGTFTTGTFNTSIVMGSVTITSAELGYIDGITLGTAAASKVMTWDVSSNWTAAGGTCADLGIVTTADINGGTIDGVSIGASNAATEATVDNIKIDGSNIGHTSDGLNLLTLESDYLTLSGGLSARGHITGGNGTTGANLSGSVHIANGDLHVKDGNLKLSNNTSQYLLMGNGTYFKMAQLTGPVSFQWDGDNIATSLSDIALGTSTTGLYVIQLDDSSTGITITNNTASDDGITPTIAVDYGHGNNTAVQGTTELTVQGTSNEVDISYATGDTTMHMGSGGTITVGLPNDVTVTNDLNVGNDLTVTGNLTVSGDMTYMFTEVTVTSAIQVKNTGTGPAIVANQTGLQPVVDFQDDGSSVFYIQDGGNIGMGTTLPNETLTVAGNISAQGVVYGSAKISLSGGESSDNWNSAYTSVRDTSGDWDSVYTSANGTSALWDTTYTTVHSYSGLWGEGPELGALSGHANATYLATFSAMSLSQARKWNSGVGYWSQSGLSNFDNDKINDTVYGVKAFDADSAANNSYLQLDVGQPLHGTKMAFTKVEVWAHATGASQTWSIQHSDDGTNFTTIDGVTVTVVNGSGEGQWTYSGNHRYWRLVNKTGSNFGDGPDYYEVQFYESILVNSQTPDNSDNWNSTYTTVGEYSGKWAANEDDITNIANTSADWDSVYTSTNETSADWDSVYTSANETSALWDTTYTTVNEFSGKWAANEDDITNVANTSGDWDSVYTSVNETSADWDSVYTSANETSALWDTTYTTVNEFSGKWAANEDDITNVANTSADWDSVYTSVSETSGDWNSVYSNTNAHSAVWTHPLSSFGLGEKITTSHSLTAGMACRLDVLGTYELSIAASNPRNLDTDVLSAEVLGIVQWSDATYDSGEEEWSGSNFEIVYSGICNLPNHEFGEPGVTLFLSPSTLGALTSAAPLLDYEVTKPVGTVIDTNTILVQPFRGHKIIPQSSSEDDWDSCYLTVNGTSGAWGAGGKVESTYTTVNNYSGEWNTTWSTMTGFSAGWETAVTKSNTNETDIAALVDDVTNVANASALWDTTYTTVYGFSGEWEYTNISTPGTVEASKAVIVDSNKDITGFRNLTIAGDLTVNGATTTVSTTNTLVEDKLITLNDGGADNTARDAGIEFEENSAIAGFIKTSSTGEEFELKVPEGGHTLTLDINGDKEITVGANLTIEGDSTINQDLTTDASVTFDKLTIANPTVPASPTATGTKGDIAYDASYMYICVATNTWKRAALVTW